MKPYLKNTALIGIGILIVLVPAISGYLFLHEEEVPTCQDWCDNFVIANQSMKLIEERHLNKCACRYYSPTDQVIIKRDDIKVINN